jgi:O-antigen ligase
VDTLTQFALHPRAWFLGFTPGEMDVIYTHYMTRTSPLIDPRFAIGHTHNLFLETILRFGLIFAGGVISILWGVYRSLKMRHSIGYPIAVFCLVSWVHIPEITHFFMLAVIIGVSLQKLKKLPKESL